MTVSSPATKSSGFAALAAQRIISLYGHLERLGPEYDAGYVHFSLNLSVAIADSNADPVQAGDLDFVRAWAWQWIDLAILGVTAGDETVAIDAAAIDVLVDPAVAPKAFIDALEAAHKDMSTELGLFSATLTMPRDPKTFDTPRRGDWKSFLTHASTFPAPLPHAANVQLTRFFRVKADAIAQAKAVELVAAPRFTGGPLGTSVPVMPGGTAWNVTQNNPLHRVPASGDQPSYYFWQYETKASLPIALSLNRCATAAAADPNDAFISLKTLWVTKTGPQLSEDWTAHFERKLAEACDMPRRLLDALGAHVDDLAWPVDNAFHDGFIASLRDLANYGLSAAPDEVRGRPEDRKTRVADALLAGVKDTTLALATLAQDEQQRYANVGAWKKRLVGELWPLIDPGAQPPVGPPVPQDGVDPRDQRREYWRALEHMYVVLATDANLVTILLAEWQQALDTGATKLFWAANKQSIAVNASGLPLRRRLAFANAGAGWRVLGPRLAMGADLPTLVFDTLANYVGDRFLPAPAGEYAAYLPGVGSPLPDLTDSLQAFAKDFVEKTLVPVTPTADDPGSTREDLTVQVADLAAADPSADDGDVLRRVAGLGVLLREHGKSDWQCLSLAQLEIAGSLADTLPAGPAPLRLHYRNGVRQSFVSYRNQPMVAKSPAAGFARNTTFGPPDPDKAIIDYASPYGAASGLKLTPLVYGNLYDAAVFVLGNAAGLPSELSTKVNDKTIPSIFRFPSTAPPAIQASIPYLRRVPVGQVRFEPPGGRRVHQGDETSRLDTPPIPDNVVPLTRSLFKTDASAQHKDVEDTLLLLTPDDVTWSGAHNFTFCVRVPSVPIEVWDRWVAKDPGQRDRRVSVWARFHEGADIAEGVSKADRPDLTIDDPAISQLAFTFTPIVRKAGSPDAVTIPVDVKAVGDCTKDLTCVQSPAVPVTVVVGDTTKIGPAAPVAQIRPGEIWRLDVAPVISEPQRFAVPQARGRATTIYIEVAEALKDDTPTPLERINKSLFVTFDAPSQEVRVRLTPDVPVPLWQRVHRVEVLLQRWRWDGRPLAYIDLDSGGARSIHYGFPPHDDDETLEPFDGVLFASRESSDHLVAPARVDFAAPSATPNAPFYATTTSALPGALYFRVAVRLFSRYEGLRLIDESIDSRQRFTNAANEPEHWKRVVVPCRFSKPVPKPAVKLVVPLTQSLPPEVISSDVTVLQPAGDDTQTIDPNSANPGLLVVLDESWYSDTLGGVGETLEWDVMRASLPDDAEATLLEFGPDPMLDLTPDPLADRLVTRAPAIGAIGYTMDTGTLAPLFTRASFVIPAPSVDGIADLSWYFMKVRFQRRLTLASDVMPRESPWTESIWTQLLPPSNRFATDAKSVDVADLALDTASGLRLRAGAAVVLKPTTGVGHPRCTFKLWALVTSAVMDALGRAGQEAFRTIVPIEGLVGALGGVVRAIVRIVEVQVHASEPPMGSETDLFAALFPNIDAAEPECRARIVRVSSPITF